MLTSGEKHHLYGAPLFKKEKESAQGDFYEYTPEGLLKCAISKGMRYAYEYDVIERMTCKSVSGRTLLALIYDCEIHGPIRQECAYAMDKNLTGLTVHSGDAFLNRTSYAYDGIDNRTEFGYDAAGNLTKIMDNQRIKTRIAYDLLNWEIRQIEKDRPFSCTG